MCSCNSNNEFYHYDVRRSNLTMQNAFNYKGKGLIVSQASRKAAVDNVNAKKQAKLDKKAAKANMTTKEKIKYAAAKGKKVAETVAMSSIADDVYYNGKIKKTVGRAATEAYLYKNGSIEVT